MDFKVLVLQTDIVWEDIEANLNNVESLIKNTTEEFNVILLPEMFSTGFSANAQALAEPIDGRTINRVKEWAETYDSLIIGSFIAEECGIYYNRGFAIEPDGTAHYYDKRHLFIGWEKQFFTPGNERLVFNYRGWNVSMCICYDLRFPVWIRNRNLEYDVLFCVTQWPVSRQNVLETLIAARAIENQAYAVASNRIGSDGNNIKYVGGSQAVDFRGRIVGRCTDSTEEAKVITLSKYALESNREKAPVWKDAENFTLDK